MTDTKDVERVRVSATTFRKDTRALMLKAFSGTTIVINNSDFSDHLFELKCIPKLSDEQKELQSTANQAKANGWDPAECSLATWLKSNPMDSNGDLDK